MPVESTAENAALRSARHRCAHIPGHSLPRRISGRGNNSVCVGHKTNILNILHQPGICSVPKRGHELDKDGLTALVYTLHIDNVIWATVVLRVPTFHANLVTIIIHIVGHSRANHSVKSLIAITLNLVPSQDALIHPPSHFAHLSLHVRSRDIHHRPDRRWHRCPARTRLTRAAMLRLARIGLTAMVKIMITIFH